MRAECGRAQNSIDMLSACRPREYTFSEWVLFLVYMAGLKCEPNLYVYEYMVEVYMIKDPVGHSRPLLLALFYDIPACSQTSYRLSEFIIFCVYDGNIVLYIHIYANGHEVLQTATRATLHKQCSIKTRLYT